MVRVGGAARGRKGKGGGSCCASSKRASNDVTASSSWSSGDSDMGRRRPASLCLCYVGVDGGVDAGVREKHVAACGGSEQKQETQASSRRDVAAAKQRHPYF